MSDIVYYRGDTEPLVFTFRDEDDAIIDITGWELVLTVNSEKRPVDDENQVFQLTGVLDDPSSGVAVFYPEVEDTNHVGTFYYDIQRVDSSDKIKTLIAGYKFKMVQDITKV